MRRLEPLHVAVDLVAELDSTVGWVRRGRGVTNACTLLHDGFMQVSVPCCGFPSPYCNRERDRVNIRLEVGCCELFEDGVLIGLRYQAHVATFLHLIAA
jgi:hypothetical protein